MDSKESSYKDLGERQRSAMDKATTGGAPRGSNLREEERSEADFGFATHQSACKPGSPKRLQAYKTVS